MSEKTFVVIKNLKIQRLAEIYLANFISNN